MRAVGKIVALFATVELFAVMIAFSGNSYYAAYVRESLQSVFSTSAWTTVDWFVYELGLFVDVALNVSWMLVLGFIGLYVGSMLRKPKTS
jgi:hypothetical protein